MSETLTARDTSTTELRQSAAEIFNRLVGGEHVSQKDVRRLELMLAELFNRRLELQKALEKYEK